MQQEPAGTTTPDPRLFWLSHRVSGRNARTLLAALRPDEDLEACVRTSSGDVLVATSSRVLLARDGVLERELRQADILAVKLRLDRHGSEVCFVAAGSESLCVAVQRAQLLEAFDAIEAVELGMRPVLVQ